MSANEDNYNTENLDYQQSNDYVANTGIMAGQEFEYEDVNADPMPNVPNEVDLGNVDEQWVYEYLGYGQEPSAKRSKLPIIIGAAAVVVVQIYFFKRRKK